MEHDEKLLNELTVIENLDKEPLRGVMRYIRTKNGKIVEIEKNMVMEVIDGLPRLVYKTNTMICVLDSDDDILKQADTIKELCDEFVMISDGKHKLDIGCHSYSDEKIQIYGAIWTDKGLIYVAKMNKKGELELL